MSKKIIAEKLMEMLNDRPLDRISVSDLANECNLSRQAFYYHFADIYSVIEWILSNASIKLLDDYGDITSWTIAYYGILAWIKKHEKFILNIYSAVPRDYIDSFTNSILLPYLTKVVEYESKDSNLTKVQKSFIARFYSLAFNSVTIDWIKGGLKEEPRQIVILVETLTKGDIAKGVKKLEAFNKINNL